MGPLLEMQLAVCPVPARDPDGRGRRQEDYELRLFELVDALFYWDHGERTDLLSLIEHLHVEGSQTGVVEPSAEHSEVVAHEQLVYSVAA